MSAWWLIGLFLAAGLAAALFLPLSLEVFYRRTGSLSQLTVYLRLFGFVLYRQSARREWPDRATDPLGPWERWLRLAKDLWQKKPLGEVLQALLPRESLVVQFLLRLRPRVLRFRWVTSVGAGDPALTALLIGPLWFIHGAILRRLTRSLLFLTPPRVTVRPNFIEPGLQVALHCILTARVGHIILVGWRTFVSALKGRE